MEVKIKQMAKTGEVRNIIVGAAAVFIADAPDVVTGLPTFQTNVSAKVALDADTVAWRNVGFTMDGVEVSYEPDYGDVEVDQLLDSALVFKQSMRVTVNTTFAEATLENLLVVWGQADDSLSGDILNIEAGELGDYPLERSVAFVGPGPRFGGRKERVYHLARAIQTESTSFALRRNEATGLPVSFRLLPDADASPVRYGTIQDRAVA